MDFLATVIVLAVALGTAAWLARPALDRQRDPATRALAGGAAVLTLVAAGLPSLRTVHPGEPLFAGEVERVGDAVPVPDGIAGPVRLLVSGKLADRGEPVVTFAIRGTREPVDGKLERTFGYARVGRGGRARVAQDHDTDFFPASIPPGSRSLQLDRLVGQLSSPLRIAVYREPIPIAGGPWVLAALALLLASVVDARLGWKSTLSVASGMAVVFGLLVTYNATPASAIGPAAGGVVLGAIVGSLAGWIVGAIVRRLVPPVKRRVPARSSPTVA